MKDSDEIRSDFFTSYDIWAVKTCVNVWPDWTVRIMFEIEFYEIAV